MLESFAWSSRGDWLYLLLYSISLRPFHPSTLSEPISSKLSMYVWKNRAKKNLQQSINYSFLENLVWPNFLLFLKCIYLAASCVCVFDNLSIVNKVINLSLCGGPMRGEYSCVIDQLEQFRYYLPPKCSSS